MQIVINITKAMYIKAKRGLLFGDDILLNAIKNGTPLPKGHGDLIDRNEIRFEQDQVFDSYRDFHIAKTVIKNAPTIIGADKARK